MRPFGAVRAGDWKLIEFYEDMRVELYNLKDDIGETRDLAQDQPRRPAELRRCCTAGGLRSAPNADAQCRLRPGQACAGRNSRTSPARRSCSAPRRIDCDRAGAWFKSRIRRLAAEDGSCAALRFPIPRHRHKTGTGPERVGKLPHISPASPIEIAGQQNRQSPVGPALRRRQNQQALDCHVFVVSFLLGE